MRKNPYGKIIKWELKKQCLIIVPKSSPLNIYMSLTIGLDIEEN